MLIPISGKVIIAFKGIPLWQHFSSTHKSLQRDSFEWDAARQLLINFISPYFHAAAKDFGISTHSDD
jgi:hypothetical protein